LVTDLHKLSNLLIDKLLLTGLLYSKSFLNFGFFQMLEGFSLLLVLCDLLFFFLLLQSYLLLKLNQLVVGILKLLSGLGHLLLFLELFHISPLHVLFDLLLDQETFSLLFLHFLNVRNSILFKLICNLLRVLFLLIGFPLRLFKNSFIVFFHLLLFELLPLLIDMSHQLSLLLLSLYLDCLFCIDIT
jgi:hypothetical protein